MKKICPRRVEFAGESFSFKSSETSRPASRAESPLPKSILRHTNSEPTSQRSSSHPATRSNTAELSLSPASRPTTLIIPTDGSGSFSSKHFNQINIHHRTPENKESNPEPGQVEEPRDRSQSNSEAENCKFSINVGSKQINVGSKQNEETSSTKQSQPVKISLLDNQDVDSDETLTEEGPKERRQRQENEREEDDHEYLGKKKRQVPPPLADWNRSQSFPPGNGELQKQSRKTSDPVALSNVSLDTEISEFYSDMDLLRSQNMLLRTRVGDLEKQVGDNVDEIKCLKGTLAECLRRIDIVETHTRHCQYNSIDGDVIEKRRPVSSPGNYSAVEQRAPSRTGSYGTRA
ncbi:uncharacterized protein LOC111707925 [Eurytemora carolleeae]|uniref:uncharacterized protein LOC111707925 n=1 Tax=Eurytemora carolleeae TaxID=1294199 RepID=UPI000C75D79F|nr:uncharacterized protein LOC111707925 [Eurytemora carolleeae]|eukprot:XP_023336881.1 uncharacterized protein LOC111707925 [Eurytemora affinis]